MSWWSSSSQTHSPPPLLLYLSHWKTQTCYSHSHKHIPRPEAHSVQLLTSPGSGGMTSSLSSAPASWEDWRGRAETGRRRGRKRGSLKEKKNVSKIWFLLHHSCACRSWGVWDMARVQNNELWKQSPRRNRNPAYACSENRSGSGNKQCWVLLLTHDGECLIRRTDWTPRSSTGLPDDGWFTWGDVMFGDVLSQKTFRLFMKTVCIYFSFCCQIFLVALPSEPAESEVSFVVSD